MKKLILLSSILLAGTALQAASTCETQSVKTTEVKSTEAVDMSSVSSDQKVEKAVKDKISSGWFATGYDQVTVRVRDGNVTLGGFVGTVEEKNKVESEVKKVEGVKSVVNDVQVKDVNKKG